MIRFCRDRRQAPLRGPQAAFTQLRAVVLGAEVDAVRALDAVVTESGLQVSTITCLIQVPTVSKTCPIFASGADR